MHRLATGARVPRRRRLRHDDDLLLRENLNEKRALLSAKLPMCCIVRQTNTEKETEQTNDALDRRDHERADNEPVLAFLQIGVAVGHDVHQAQT